MPQMTLTADEAKMIRAHRKAGEARKWFMAGVEASVQRLQSFRARPASDLDDRTMGLMIGQVLDIEPPRDLTG